jgi:hypothetical protein
MPLASPGCDASPEATSGQLHRLRRNPSPMSEWRVNHPVNHAASSGDNSARRSHLGRTRARRPLVFGPLRCWNVDEVEPFPPGFPFWPLENNVPSRWLARDRLDACSKFSSSCHTQV